MRSLRFALVALLLVAPAGAKDLRTAMLRLVPDSPATDWKPEPHPVALSVEILASGEKTAEFGAAFDKWTRWAFPKLKYKLDDGSATRVKVIVDEIDLGNAGLRFAVGFGAGKSYVRGRVLVEEGGKPVGSFTFTARPEGFSPEGMAKEVAPIVVLKLDNHERDSELHEANAKEGSAPGGEKTGS
jgi:hypothetical protein